MSRSFEKFSLRYQNLSETFFDKLGSIAKEVALRTEANLAERSRIAAYQTYRKLKQEKENNLFSIYSSHLNLTKNEIRTIHNEYPKVPPKPPSKQIKVPDSSNPGQYKIVYNPLHPLEVRDFEVNMRKYKKREDLLQKIRGIHRMNPHVRRISDHYSSLMKWHSEKMENADPVVDVVTNQDGSTVKIRKSHKLLSQADALRSSRS